MNLIEKWKSRETKKKLRDENIRLKTEIEALNKIPKPPVCTIERNVQKVCSCLRYNGMQLVPPSDIIKEDLCREMIKYIEPFIQYDFERNGYGEEAYTAILYVATGDKRNESLGK